jgi:lipopolysaccharide transport system ATP-binding protein
MEVVSAENLSKLYYINDSKPYSLRDAITGLFSGGQRRDHSRELWALRDVSFSVREGETLGVIGNNGAGKSTLLKVLSRITKPTKGRAEIRGRVGSLLEVGTGFHSELSGRENIYLNGAILGMRRREIEAKFDEIVAFSELEDFLDTPVKHYSSGMYMRLAFSIAAHLEPEILIVDEVLAVGDINFQRKCLNAMRDVSQAGRTVLFVSHNMTAVARLCNRAIWLKDGELKLEGETAQIVNAYRYEQSQTGAEKVWNDPATAPADEVARLQRLRVHTEEGKTSSALDIRRRIGVEMTYEVLKGGVVLIPNIHFYNEEGVCLFISHDWFSGWRDRPKNVGTYTSTVWIPGNFLSEGAIFVTAALSTYKPFIVHFVVRDAVSFNVVDTKEADSARGDYAGQIPGLVRPILVWETKIS